MLNINDIKNFLPHRYPFLLIDRVLEASSEKVVAIKNVSANEAFFQGHFPDNPVMPGVLQVEAMAQTAAFLAYDEYMAQKESGKTAEVYFVSIDSCKFKKVVVPGDQLLIEINIVKRRREFWWIEGVITVDGAVVCEAKLSAVLKMS